MKKRSLGILVFCLLLFGLCGTAFAAEKTKRMRREIIPFPLRRFDAAAARIPPKGHSGRVRNTNGAHYMGMCGGSMPHALRDRISFILYLILKRTKPHWNMMNSTNWGQLHPQGASA